MCHECHVWCDRNKLPQGVVGLHNLKSCIGGNKSKYTAPNHNILPSYVSLENINHKWYENGTDCRCFGTLNDDKCYNSTLKKR